MSKPVPTNRSNECPVCADISGKCRTKDDGGQEFILCMNNSDAKLFEIIDGYKCIKPGKKGWATFTLDANQPQLSDEKRQQRRAKREAEQKAIYQAGLSIAERHKAYSQIAAQLPLHPKDQADLQRRGLSAEITATFASIESWQPLNQSVNKQTPGSNGRKLLSKYSGCLVPARNIEGQITGFQIRNRETGSDAPKYPWLSTQTRPANLQNGELPITFADGDGAAINLCEGLLKPLVAAEMHCAQFIGAAGGNFASSPQQLTNFLHQLQPEQLILCPDGGAVANRQVMHQYRLLAELVESLGYRLSVRWWGQVNKADGDIDEISREQFQNSELLSWQEFAAKVPGQNSTEETEPKAKAKKQTQAEWKKQQRKKRDARAYAQIAKLLDIEVSIDTDSDNYQASAKDAFYQPLKKHLKYETHAELTSGFASELKPAADGRSLLAYDISQGGGKSNNCLIPAALRTASSGGRALILVPTRGLAKEFKGRINERAGENIAATHLDENYHSAPIVVSCPESAYKFKGQNFDLLQADEANEVLHRIESAELGNAGPQSLEAFRKLLASIKTVAIATAAMSGRTLAAVQTIGGFTPQETQLQRRARPATEMKVIEYSNFYQWLAQIIDALRNGQRVAIPTGAQGKGRMIDRILRSFFPEKSGLAIDGSATLQNQRSRFLADPDAFLELTKPDWFIYSPVINSGVSVEGQHFNAQFEYATPHEGAQSISQRGERIRSAIGRDGAITERHIYFSQQGAPTLEAYPGSLDWQYWHDELADEANAPMGAAAALAKALGATKALDPAKREAEKFAAMRPNLPHFLALKGFEIIFKKELLHEDWERYGWDVSEAPKPDKEEKKQLSALKEFCDQVRIGLIKQEGRTLKKTQTRESEGELDEINNPFQAARAAKQQIEKILGKGYLSQQNEEFFTAWVADKTANNPGVRSVIRSQLLNIAVAAPECWEQIERMKALKFLAGKPEADSELFWHLPELPAAARDIELASIISRCPGIADVITGRLQTWTNKDPLVLAAGLYLISHGKQIAANTKKQGLIRGAKFSEQMAPAALFNKALEMMGYAPHKVQRQGSGKRLNVYRLANEADAVKALAQLKEDEEDSALKLFRAELKVIRAQTRESINQAAHRCIMGKFAAWGSEAAQGFIQAAEAGIKGRHAVLNASGLSNVGDALEKPADAQRELVLSAAKAPPPKPKKDYFATQDTDPLADNYYNAAAWS